jgi:hypothetical protein
MNAPSIRLVRKQAMKTASLVVAAAALLAPAAAFAQPAAYAPPPPPPPGYAMPAGPPAAPGGFHDRAGRLSLGFSVGLGRMQLDDSDIACNGCDGDPVSFEGDVHIGWMMSPRLSLLLEAQGVGQTIADNDSYTDTLIQTTGVIGAQYWVTPQLWIKGGLGAAQLVVSRDDGFATSESDSLDGGAIMGAVGYEVMSARNFAIDLQLRATGANFKDTTVNLDGTTSDTNVGTTSLSLGFNWY